MRNDVFAQFNYRKIGFHAANTPNKEHVAMATFYVYCIEQGPRQVQYLYSSLSSFHLQPEYHGTLKPADNFNAKEDAESLKKAMKGFGKEISILQLLNCIDYTYIYKLLTPPQPSHLITGSDEDAIMAVLGARTNKQRQEIAAQFQQEYDKVRE